MKKSQKTGKRKKDTVRRDEAPGTPSGSVEDKPLPFRTLLPLVLIVLVGIYSYWNSFHAPFVFDDQTSITENPIIKNLGNFLSSLQGYHYNPRRFIGYLSFALNYHWGGLDVAGYHVVNFCIHLLNGTLVFLLCGLTFRTPFLRNSSQASKAGGIALVAALLFTAHPVQTQAVTYIVQRFTSLASLFYLLSLIFYVQGRNPDLKEGDAGRAPGFSSSQSPDPSPEFFVFHRFIPDGSSGHEDKGNRLHPSHRRPPLRSELLRPHSAKEAHRLRAGFADPSRRPVEPHRHAPSPGGTSCRRRPLDPGYGEHLPR